MISEKTKATLVRLFKEQGIYKPADAIAERLAQKSVFMFVGATCEGKNAVMEAITKLDDRFYIIGTQTSRPPRDSDDPAIYTYHKNTDTGLQKLLEKIEKREMVQYAINLYSYFIYGSTIDDYSGEYGLGDVFSSAVEDFRHLGFKRATAITVISDPAIWLARFKERFPVGHPQRRARRDEAIESFNWSLSQTGNDHCWVENVDGQPEIAAQEVVQIAAGKLADNPDMVRDMVRASLQAAKDIKL